MKLRDRVTILAPAHEVWPWIADPARLAQWNPQLVAVDRRASGEVRQGERFAALYRLKRRERESQIEVVVCQPPVAVVYRHRFPEQAAEHFVDVSYAVNEAAGETVVEQSIDLSRSGIAWPWRLIIGLIFRVGRPVGERYLERLRRSVEVREQGAHARCVEERAPLSGHSP